MNRNRLPSVKRGTRFSRGAVWLRVEWIIATLSRAVRLISSRIYPRARIRFSLDRNSKAFVLKRGLGLIDEVQSDASEMGAGFDVRLSSVSETGEVADGIFGHFAWSRQLGCECRLDTEFRVGGDRADLWIDRVGKGKIRGVFDDLDHSLQFGERSRIVGMGAG